MVIASIGFAASGVLMITHFLMTANQSEENR